jgi:hypothetical protein
VQRRHDLARRRQPPLRLGADLRDVGPDLRALVVRERHRQRALGDDLQSTDVGPQPVRDRLQQIGGHAPAPWAAIRCRSSELLRSTARCSAARTAASSAGVHEASSQPTASPHEARADHGAGGSGGSACRLATGPPSTRTATSPPSEKRSSNTAPSNSAARLSPCSIIPARVTRAFVAATGVARVRGPRIG